MEIIMATKFNMIRDINGYNGFGLEFSDTNYSIKLSAATEANFTVPKNTSPNIATAPYDWIAIFSIEPGDAVWVAKNDTAVAPTGTFSATASSLNPVARVVKSGDTLSFISNNDNVEVGVSLYAL
jgi:hypothetical protein